MNAHSLGLLALVTSLGCQAPPVIGSPGNPAPAGVIAGTITVSGVSAKGDAYLFLVPQPGEPGACAEAGSSAIPPADAVRIPEAALYRDPGGDTHSAPFVIPQVEPGCWSIVAMVDADDDFNPLFSVTSGFTAGDGIGGAFSTPPTLRVLSVSAEGEFPPAIEGVQVVVGVEAPFERPSFTVAPGGEGVGLSITTDAKDPVPIQLDVAPLVGDWATTADLSNPEMPRGPFFPIVLDPASGAVKGTEVYLRRLSPAGATGDAPPWTRDTDTPLILAARIDPTPFAGVDLPEGRPFHVATTLRVFVLPLAFPPPAPGVAPELTDLATLEAREGASPKGRYSVLVKLTATNQTWELPNELVLLGPDLTQGAAFIVE